MISREEYAGHVAALESGRKVVVIGGRTCRTIDELDAAIELATSGAEFALVAGSVKQPADGVLDDLAHLKNAEIFAAEKAALVAERDEVRAEVERLQEELAAAKSAPSEADPLQDDGAGDPDGDGSEATPGTGEADETGAEPSEEDPSLAQDDSQGEPPTDAEAKPAKAGKKKSEPAE